MQGTDFVLQSLVADGIDHVFMVPGGLIDPFLPALGRTPALTPIVAAQEGGAAYMADGYARASGKFGTCLVIGGPGLTNTVTALSAAYADQSPVLVLSGEVANSLQGMGFFQDATAGTFDDGAIVAPVTAQSYSVPDIRLLSHKLRGAIKRMVDGKCAPVHLGLSHEIQVGNIDCEPKPIATELLHSQPLDIDAANKLWERLRSGGSAPRIGLLVGGGLISDDAAADLLQAAERFHLPVATTEHAKGLFPEDHELSLGVFGYAGTRHATQAFLKEKLDLLIVLGATLNVRDSMYWSGELAPRLGVLAVNVSNLHVGCHFDAEGFIGGHGGAFLRFLRDAPEDEAKPLIDTIPARRQWIKGVRMMPRFYDIANTASDERPIHPARMISECRKVMPRNTIAIVDSGAHRAFGVHYWDSYGPREFLTASGLGPMGWGIPAGIGAKAAAPEKPVVVFTGDGCMRMHGLEVQTAARFGLPVIFVVSNNAALGNVWLRAHELGPVPAHLTEAPDQDWAALGRALGCMGETVTDPNDLEAAFSRALEANKPCVIDVKTARDAPTPVEPYSQAAHTWSYHA